MRRRGDCGTWLHILWVQDIGLKWEQQLNLESTEASLPTEIPERDCWTYPGQTDDLEVPEPQHLQSRAPGKS